MSTFEFYVFVPRANGARGPRLPRSVWAADSHQAQIHAESAYGRGVLVQSRASHETEERAPTPAED